METNYTTEIYQTYVILQEAIYIFLLKSHFKHQYAHLSMDIPTFISIKYINKNISFWVLRLQ